MPKRIMSWVLIAWSAIFLIWIIAGVASRPSTNCVAGDTLCHNASNAGTAIGVGLIIVFWFIGFVALSIIWLLTRPSGRSCPACGTNVKPGKTQCPKCNHDFVAAVAPVPSPGPPPPAP